MSTREEDAPISGLNCKMGDAGQQLMVAPTRVQMKHVLPAGTVMKTVRKRRRQM